MFCNPTLPFFVYRCMLKWLVLIVTGAFLSLSYAQVRVDSYYFEPGTTNYADQSKASIDSFKVLQSKKYIQVIEINGFADDSDSKKAKKLSQARIDTFMNVFQLQALEITINNYGNKKERVPFNVLNWDRIDVYYHIDDFGLTIKEDITHKETPKDTSERKMMDLPEKEKKITPKVNFGTPQVIPIKFKGGTNKVLPESYHYLDALVDTMKNNSFLTAHIRGHVCCGNNVRISKKRAKAVYTYLVKHGVESHRLSYKGYSNTEPLVFPERTAADRATNRRVDIIFNNGENVIIDD